MTPPSNFALRIIVEEDPKFVWTPNAHYATRRLMAGWKPAKKMRFSMSLPDTSPDDRGLAPAAWLPPGGSWPTSRTP
jgi:hypothetical protein